VRKILDDKGVIGPQAIRRHAPPTLRVAGGSLRGAGRLAEPSTTNTWTPRFFVPVSRPAEISREPRLILEKYLE
jgi:hypothetical protein